MIEVPRYLEQFTPKDTTVLGLVVGFYVLIAVMFLLYLAFCALNRARLSGKLALTPWPVRFIGYQWVVIAFIIDVAFNFTIGTVMFWEWPSFRRITFTKRCSYWLDDLGWRGKRAHWVCDGWLNPFEDNHCKKR